MNRSGFLGSAAALGSIGGGAPAVAQEVASPAPVGTAASSPAPARRASQFFTDASMNFIFQIVLGGVNNGISDVGTVLAVIDHVTDGDAASAYAALTAYGTRALRDAENERAAGHRASARSRYLEASNFLFAATYFCDGMHAPERIVPTWRTSRNALDRAFALFDHPVEPVRIPYAGTTLPGYVITPDASGVRRPLFIMCNGSDGSVLDLWVQGGAAAIARGYNVLIFDGPGQGAALWLQHLHFRPDWEKVVTPVVDYALTRPEVDPHKLVLQGISQGGYWGPRAMAFEHRLAAGIADPGVYDVATSWLSHLPAPLVAMLNAGQKAAFDQAIAPALRSPDYQFRARPYGIASPYDLYVAVQTYTLAGVVDRITEPILITNPQNEQFWPGQPHALFDRLPGPKKAIVPFTVAEGADGHCEPLAPGLRSIKVFDWLDTTIGYMQPRTASVPKNR